MPKYKMTRWEGGSALRTDSVEGEGNPPEVGEQFCLVGEPLDPAFSMRLIHTSPVVKLWRGLATGGLSDSTWIRTESGSLYEVEEL